MCLGSGGYRVRGRGQGSSQGRGQGQCKDRDLGRDQNRGQGKGAGAEAGFRGVIRRGATLGIGTQRNPIAAALAPILHIIKETMKGNIIGNFLKIAEAVRGIVIRVIGKNIVRTVRNQ